MSYTAQQVHKGQRLVATLNRSQWELGDLALKIDHADVRAFGEEIGVPHNSLARYRQVSAAFPPDKRRLDVSWSVHRLFIGLDDRYKILHQRKKWTWVTAEQFLGHPAADGGARRHGDPRRISAEDIADAIGADPHLIDDILTNQQARHTIHDAEQRRHAEMSETHRMETKGQPLDRLLGWMIVDRHIGDAKKAVRTALERLLDQQTLQADQKDALLESANELRTGVDMLIASIETGDRSFEDQLADLLGGNEQ